jgi:hypothetical protein
VPTSRPLYAYRELVGDAANRLLLVIPPAAPPQPTFGATPPATLRMRTRAGGWIALSQLDGTAPTPPLPCIDCDCQVFEFQLQKSDKIEEFDICGCYVPHEYSDSEEEEPMEPRI